MKFLMKNTIYVYIYICIIKYIKHIHYLQNYFKHIHIWDIMAEVNCNINKIYLMGVRNINKQSETKSEITL